MASSCRALARLAAGVVAAATAAMASPAVAATGQTGQTGRSEVSQNITVRVGTTAASPQSLLELPMPTVDVPPPGANDWDCQPNAGHPNPVVLVHGTFASMYESWLALSPRLAQRGYCVFALNYGDRGTGPIQESAKELAAFVDRVLDATGAEDVSIVGHSQGGMMPHYYLAFLGGAREVEELIGIAPSNHGTTSLLAPPAGAVFCTACTQQSAGSDFLRKLNSGGEVEPGVDYTVIATRYDEVVTPYTSQFLDGPRVRSPTSSCRKPARRTCPSM